MGDDSIDMEHDSIDVEDDNNMTASIWEMTVSIWDIMSLCSADPTRPAEPTDTSSATVYDLTVIAIIINLRLWSMLCHAL